MRGWLLMLAGCAGPSEPSTPVLPTPAPTPPVEPERPAWRRTGDLGDLAVLREARPYGGRPSLRFAAVFADDLQDLAFPAACDRFGELCLPTDAPHEEVFETAGFGLDPDASRFGWVGDALVVGGRAAPFDVFDPPTAGYAARVIGSGPLPARLPLAFSGGEWGDYASDTALPTPRGFEVIEPDPSAPVFVGDAPFQSFGWTPVGSGRMLLTLRNAHWSAARWLDDDGQALLDLQPYRLTEPMRVDLWHVAPAETLEIDGNALSVTAISSQAWCLVGQCDPPFPALPGVLSFEFCWGASGGCGTSRWFIQPDGTWNTLEGFVGTWAWDCCTRELDLVFSSGTHYRGRVDADGCIVGEMLSWSGNTGTWSGCL